MKPASLASFVAIGTYGCSVAVRRMGLPAVWNKGVAFSSLENGSTWASAVGFAVLLAVTAMADKKQAPTKNGLILLWGGAMGNMIDRLLYGAVMDYIPVPFWPGGLYLNVADLALIGGALSILWGTFKAKTQEETQKEGKP